MCVVPTCVCAIQEQQQQQPFYFTLVYVWLQSHPFRMVLLSRKRRDESAQEVAPDGAKTGHTFALYVLYSSWIAKELVSNLRKKYSAANGEQDM